MTPAHRPATGESSVVSIAHQRLSALFDPGTVELLAGDPARGALSAHGTLRGVPAVAFATDPGYRGGSLAVADCDAIIAGHSFALEHGRPILGIWHSGGAGLAEGARTMDRVARMMRSIAAASGRILHLSVVLGPSAGAAAYASTLADIVILAEAGRLAVTGPDVVRSLTGEVATLEELGGSVTHSEHSGVAHLAVGDQAEAFERARDVVTLLTSQGAVAADVPDAAIEAGQDAHALAAAILDPGSWLELHPRWAPQLVAGLGRLGGRTVGVVANEPRHVGGWLDGASADKGARFVRMCDAFGVPLVVLANVPGILPGLAEERDGALRRGAKIFHAFATATVPRVTVTTGRVYGGAFLAMNARGLGATRVLAWPDADLAVMPPDAAVRVLFRRQLADLAPDERADAEARLIEEHARELGGVAAALEAGAVDEIVEPGETRGRIAEILRGVDDGRRGSHTNIPL